MHHRVTVFLVSAVPNCRAVRTIFESMPGIPCEIVDLGDKPARRQEMIRLYPRSSNAPLPQLFVDTQYIGGYEDFIGHLDKYDGDVKRWFDAKVAELERASGAKAASPNQGSVDHELSEAISITPPRTKTGKIAAPDRIVAVASPDRIISPPDRSRTGSNNCTNNNAFGFGTLDEAGDSSFRKKSSLAGGNSSMNLRNLSFSRRRNTFNESRHSNAANTRNFHSFSAEDSKQKTSGSKRVVIISPPSDKESDSSGTVRDLTKNTEMGGKRNSFLRVATKIFGKASREKSLPDLSISQSTKERKKVSQLKQQPPPPQQEKSTEKSNTEDGPDFSKYNGFLEDTGKMKIPSSPRNRIQHSQTSIGIGNNLSKLAYVNISDDEEPMEDIEDAENLTDDKTKRQYSPEQNTPLDSEKESEAPKKIMSSSSVIFKPFNIQSG